MTNSTIRQALAAAFSFGLVVYAATSAVALVLRGRTSNLFRDAPRLAFITFLASAALWAQVDLFGILINVESVTSCQVAITFASIFDQSSRVCLQQSILWIFNKYTKASPTETIVCQGFILLRFILGGAFVIFQRPQLDALCLAHTSVLTAGIFVLVVDGSFVAILLTRAVSHGLIKDAWEGVLGTSQGRAIVLVIVGLGIWTITSAPLMLGIQSIAVAARTMVPALGLLALIAIITFIQTHFLLSAKPEPRSPTENAPYGFDANRDLQARGISTADSTIPSSQHEELRKEAWDVPTASSRLATGAMGSNQGLPIITRPALGQAAVGMGGIPVQGQLFPPPRAQTVPLSMEMRGLEKSRPKWPVRMDSKLAISKPILQNGGDGNPFAKIATVDLAIAARNENRRFEPEENPRAPGMMVNKAPYQLREPARMASQSRNGATVASQSTPVATTTSVLLSPGVEELRRRSPRQPSSPNSSKPKLASLAVQPLAASPPRERARLDSQKPGTALRETIVNFSLPVDGRSPAFSRKKPIGGTPKSTPSSVQPKDAGEERSETEQDFTRAASMVHRPRPIPRKPTVSRGIFPAEDLPNLPRHKRSFSCGSVRDTRPIEIQPPPVTIENLNSSHLSDLAKFMLAKETGNLSSQVTTSKGRRRRSLSVPDLPILPLSFSKAEARTSDRVSQQTDELFRAFPMPSTRTAFAVSQSPKSPTPPTPRSLNRDASPLQDQKTTWGFQRRSSPVLPIEDFSVFSPDTSTIRDDDSTVNWDVRSPATRVYVQRALAVEVTATTKNQPHQDKDAWNSTINHEANKGSLAAMLESSTEQVVGLASDLRRTEDSRLNAERQHIWPRQVGETRPTFSDRGHAVKQRRSPPPAPLLLGTGKVSMVQAEPSPIESDEGDLGQTLERGRNLDSLIFKDEVAFPSSMAGKGPAETEQQRMTLLANLEQELTEQEGQWQAIRHTMLGRDSLSTVGTSPSRDSRHGSVWHSGAPRRLSRRAQLETSADDDLLSLLAQATGFKSGKMKHSTTSSSFPGFSASLASPTPPDTESESEYEEDPEALVGRTQYDVAKPAIALWRPITSEVVVAAAAATAPSLWTPVPKTGAAEMAPGEIHEGSIRRAARKDLEPLAIESSRLWEKPAPKHPVAHRGLWRAASVPSQHKTQVVEVNVQQRKPPRRIRRVTLLPDILESPKPFDRRGTLGIFQFPWGEKSDCATVAPRALTLMAMPGTMASRGDSGLINAGVVGGVQSDEESSSSSFMDDYEREDDDGEYYDDESSDYETYDSDAEEDDEDGVDETTMWEIVGLLEPSQRKISSEGELPHHHQGECDVAGLRSEAQKEKRAAAHAEADQDSAKISDDNNRAAAMSLLTTNISSSQADSPPKPGPGASATDSQISQTQGPHSRMTPTDMDLRRRLHGKVEGEREGDQGQGQASQGLTKLDAHLIASSAADAAIGGAAPRPEPPAASISSVPSPSISNAPVPHPWSRAPMNDAVATHETALPQLLPNRTPASSSPLTWTSSPVELPPSQHIRNQGAAHPVSWRVSGPSPSASADLSAAESAPVNSARHIQIRGASANLNSDSLLSSFPLPPQHSPRHQNLHWNLDATRSIQSMALWSPPSPPVLHPSKGLAQPDAATWNAYLPTDDIARVLPAKAELLPTIESNSLWTPPPKKVEEPSHHGLWGTKSPSTLPGMWTQPPVLVKVSYGLPQPDAETWATYLVVMDDLPRVKPREAEPAFVESFSLWTAPKPAIPEEPSEDGLWSGSSASSSVGSVSGSEPSTPREAVNFGLWEPAPATVAGADDEEPTGLFSLTHRRTEYRTTKLSPAALDMARSPRRPLEPYPDFGFTHLWNMAPLWDAKATAAAVQLQRDLDELVLEGLFSLNHRRNNFRTTSEAPAALETRPKLRISQDPLPKLSSDCLWSVRAPAEAPVELDWITLSTVRPRTSSVASSTDNESFVSARSTTTTTAASSVKSEACSTTLTRTAARRFDATPAQWLAALDEATRASELGLYVRRSSPETDKDATTLDLAADSDPCSPDSSSQSNYQLWSKPDSDDSESPSVELWKPSSSPPTNPRFLELTPALRDYDKQNASSGTSHRGRTLEKSRPPPPIMHGSTSSAFLPAVSSETPRDFSAQALWARAQSPAGGPSHEDENSWLDKSLRKSLSFVQLW